MTIAARLTMVLLAVASLREPVLDGGQTHATRGTVKSAAPAAIVVARSKNRGDITLTMAPSTKVDGTIRVGATVSVRYHDEHGRHVAIAVAVERPPAPKAGFGEVNRN